MEKLLDSDNFASGWLSVLLVWFEAYDCGVYVDREFSEAGI